MSILTDPLRRLCLPDISSAPSFDGKTLANWVAKKAYYVSSVVSSDQFTLQVGATSDVLPLFATSADRMPSSCFETILSIKPLDTAPRSSAWLLLKLYYAAFYAAHAHLRLAGQTCSLIEPAQAITLLESASAYGAVGSVSKINSGL